MRESTFARFLRGTFFTGMGKVSSIALGLVTFILSVRFLAPQDLGAFVLLNSIVVFVNGLTDLGINAATTRFIAGISDEQERRRLFNTALYFRIACIVVFSTITLLGQRLLFGIFGASLPTHLVLFIPLLVTFDSLVAILAAYLAGQFKFKQVGSIDLVNAGAGFLGLLIFVVWHDLGLMGRIYARMTATACGLVFAYSVAHVRHKLEFDLDGMKKMFRFGFPLNLNYIFNTLFTRADTFLIGALLGPAEIAMYEIARKIPDSIGMLIDAFHKVFYPIVSNMFALKKIKQLSNVVNQANRLFGFLNAFGSLIAFTFGGLILAWLFSDGYSSNAPVFGILMISLGFLAINTNMGYSLSAAGDTMKPFLINIVPTIASLIGYVALIPVFGITGAALSTMAGMIIANPIFMYVLKRKTIVVNVLDYLKSFLILGGCFIILQLFPAPNLWIKALVLLLYLIVCFAFSVITMDDISLIAEELRKITASLRNRLQPGAIKSE